MAVGRLIATRGLSGDFINSIEYCPLNNNLYCGGNVLSILNLSNNIISIKNTTHGMSYNIISILRMDVDSQQLFIATWGGGIRNRDNKLFELKQFS